jgi:hypothetical protein
MPPKIHPPHRLRPPARTSNSIRTMPKVGQHSFQTLHLGGLRGPHHGWLPSGLQRPATTFYPCRHSAEASHPMLHTPTGVRQKPEPEPYPSQNRCPQTNQGTLRRFRPVDRVIVRTDGRITSGQRLVTSMFLGFGQASPSSRAPTSSGCGRFCPLIFTFQASVSAPVGTSPVSR